MHHSIAIRDAQLSDHSQLRPLLDQLDRLHIERAPWLLREVDEDARSLAWLEALLSNDDEALLVADAGQCVGLATVCLRGAPNFPFFIRQQHAVINDLVVHPDWRRQGVARRLCTACEDWARARQAAWLEVNVYEFNTEASDLYSALGFATTTRRLRKAFDG